MLSKLYKFLSGKQPAENPPLYEGYWNTKRGSYGAPFVPLVCDNYKFESVLDAGCGEGTVVREFLRHGKKAKGVELSATALKECPDLVSSGIVVNSGLQSIPHPDSAFDLVFSSEVLEHIPENDIPIVAREISRVSKSYIFLTISLRPSSDNNAYHATLKPRRWWESQFESLGWKVDQRIVDKFQKRVPGASIREVLELGPTKAIMNELDWFIDGKIVEFNGEVEPWFFAFSRT